MLTKVVAGFVVAGVEGNNGKWCTAEEEKTGSGERKEKSDPTE
jgi:hypothetical protein